jgi:FixJ family two-component response regulator
MVSADRSLKNIAKSVGAKGFIEKPFSMTKFLANINTILGICG